MEKIISLLNPILKYLEKKFHEYHPNSLRCTILSMLCITHIFAISGFRPILTVTLIIVLLHILDLFKSISETGTSTEKTELCKSIQFFLPYYNMACHHHQSLQTLKVRNYNCYWIIFIGLCSIPINIFMFISAFYECYLVLIILYCLLQYNYPLLLKHLLGNDTNTNRVLLLVNPMSKEVLLNFTHTESGKQFNSTSESEIDFSGKDDGTYTANISIIFGTQHLQLPSFTVSKNISLMAPNIIDLKVARIESDFFYKDVPFSGADVNGTFIGKDGRSNIRFVMKTSTAGCVHLTCPEGQLRLEANKMIEGAKVNLQQEMYVPPQSPVTSEKEINDRKPIVFTVNKASSLIINGIQFSGSVVILGDCSGSMSADNNIEKLKRSYSLLWENFKQGKFKSNIGFTVWDTQSYFCKISWLNLADEQIVQNWIAGLHARGGNDMQTAITDAIGAFTALENIVVICDGDVSPYNLESWKIFRARYPHIRFHFVAVGSGSDFQIMKDMAVIGNGSFTATNI